MFRKLISFLLVTAMVIFFSVSLPGFLHQSAPQTDQVILVSSTPTIDAGNEVVSLDTENLVSFEKNILPSGVRLREVFPIQQNTTFPYSFILMFVVIFTHTLRSAKVFYVHGPGI